MGYPPCSAPARAPRPVPNATLLTVFLFIRHGARVPLWRWEHPSERCEWHCGGDYLHRPYRCARVNGGSPVNFSRSDSGVRAFPPSCDSGMLLDSGAAQLRSLGAALSEYLVRATQLLPSDFAPELVRVRSSFYPRCVESAVALVDGMYPPARDGESLAVAVGAPEREPLCPNPAWRGFEERWRAFAGSARFAERVRGLRRCTAAVEEYYNASAGDDVGRLLVGDFINARRCEGQPYPRAIADPCYDDLMAGAALFVQGFAEAAQPYVDQPIIEMLMAEIDAFYAGARQRFTLFSGHDVTISAVLLFLGVGGLKAPPPYASNVLVELWRSGSGSDFVRFVYNGDVLPFMGKDMTPLAELRDAVRRRYSGFDREL